MPRICPLCVVATAHVWPMCELPVGCQKGGTIGSPPAVLAEESRSLQNRQLRRCDGMNAECLPLYSGRLGFTPCIPSWNPKQGCPKRIQKRGFRSSVLICRSAGPISMIPRETPLKSIELLSRSRIHPLARRKACSAGRLLMLDPL